MLITSALFLLTSNAVAIRRDKSILYSRIAATILLLCFSVCFNCFYFNFHGKGVGIFSGLLQTTATTHVFHLFVILITVVILQLNSFYPRKVSSEQYSSIFKLLFFRLKYLGSSILNKMSEQYRIIEYPLIMLFVLLGGVFLISSDDFISIFLSLELQSYGLYILCVAYKDSERATSGGLTYFLLGGLSSCFILLAFGLVYANSGNTSFDGMYVINTITGANNSLREVIYESLLALYGSNYLNFALVIMSAGFLFKISAAPFHFWSPDVYDAIPTVVTTFVATFAKISILILLLELIHSTSHFISTDTNIFDEESLFSGMSWTFTLLLSSFLSLVIGSVLGLTQFRIKRLYAYSTISHVGFILLALSVNSIESIQSFIFYLMQYTITNINAFFLLTAIAYSLYLYVESKDKVEKDGNKQTLNSKISDRNNSPIQLISQIKGYFYINPFTALSLGITLFSFAGIPPLIGFFAKQMVLSSALDNGYVFMALVGILTSVISAYYYLAVVKQVFFDSTDYITNPLLKNIPSTASISNLYSGINKNIVIGIDQIQLSSFLTITISILTLTILLFIFAPQEWLNMAIILALILFNN